MVLEKRCPACERLFEIDYLQMCFCFRRLRTWAHQCPLCENYMRLPIYWEAPIMFVGICLAAELGCDLFLQIHVLVAAAAAGVFYFLIGGAMRYWYLKFQDPVYTAFGR